MLVLVGTTVVLVIAIIVARLHKPPGPAVLMATHNAQMAAVDKEWSQFSFVSLTNQVAADRVNALISEAERQCPVTEEQGSRLSQEILDFFRAYSAGTFASYKAFRMPSGIPYHLTTNKLGDLDTALKSGKTVALPKALQRWSSQPDLKRVNWGEKSVDDKFLLYLKLYAGETLYSNYFTGIAFDHSRIVFTQCKAKPIPSAIRTVFFVEVTNKYPLAVAPAGFPNMGYGTQKNYTFIKFDDSAEETENRNGTVVMADCFLFMKRCDADGFLPVIARFYWEPKAKRWLPEDLAVCNLNQKGDLWPLF